MFGIGMSELLIIMVIVLIIFGAGKLPEIGSALGKGIRNFKTGVTGNESEDKAPQSKIETHQEQKKLE
ncbi:MAG: twin-arginine translocase TatA/TatE family subunit [bacterium]